ncbi:hypothetical protein [Cellulophaga baltica]|uniref:hypothetical protein n=1 Tax=Cellulophaga baltica TaxID=76594 RepID=UPI0024940724|nr:hypothetical protein [Cellulophaga baltica]
MRNLILLLSALVLSTSSVLAVNTEDKVAPRNAYTNTNSFIFVENGITFSVYPDGEFDFYIDERAGVNANVNIGRTNITFNSGYDYNPYVQYDDYGAIIQVENVPVYYDYYGRVTEIGEVAINYNNNRVARVGGMYVFYDNRGYYSHNRGFINVYNRSYVYRPFHSYFARPAIGFCLVNTNPYRRYYSPVRYTYYNPYRYNTRRTYAVVGREHRYNKVRNERARVYKNDRRVAQRTTHSRSYNSPRSSKSTVRSNYRTPATRSNTRGVASRTSTTNRKSNTRADYRTPARSNSKNAATRSNTSSRNATNVKREVSVTKNPRSTTVTRSTTYRSPSNNKSSTQRTSTSTRNSGISSRSSSSSRATKSTPTRQKSVSTKSTSTRKSSSTPSRSTRSTSTSTRSSRSRS